MRLIPLYRLPLAPWRVTWRMEWWHVHPHWHHPQSVRITCKACVLGFFCWRAGIVQTHVGTDRPQHRAASQCPVLLHLREECLKVSKGSGRLLCVKAGWLFYTYPRVADIFLSDVLLVGDHLLEWPTLVLWWASKMAYPWNGSYTVCVCVFVYVRMYMHMYDLSDIYIYKYSYLTLGEHWLQICDYLIVSLFHS